MKWWGSREKETGRSGWRKGADPYLMGDMTPRIDFCIVAGCMRRAEDEYHFFEDLWGGQVEITWKLCEGHCDFAMDVVESVAEIDNPSERKGWVQWM